MNNSSFKKHHNKKLVDESFLREAIRSILIKSEASSVLTEGTQKVAVGFANKKTFTVHNSNSNSIPDDAASLFSGTYVLDVSDLSKEQNLAFTKFLATKIGLEDGFKESGTGIGEEVLYSTFNNMFRDLGEETVVDCIIESPVLKEALNEQDNRVVDKSEARRLEKNRRNRISSANRNAALTPDQREQKLAKRRALKAANNATRTDAEREQERNKNRKKKIDNDGSLIWLNNKPTPTRDDKIFLIKQILSMVDYKGTKDSLNGFISDSETIINDFCLKFYETWEEVLLAKSRNDARQLLLSKRGLRSPLSNNAIDTLASKPKVHLVLFKYISDSEDETAISKFVFYCIKEKLAAMKNWKKNPPSYHDRGEVASPPVVTGIRGLFNITWNSLVTGDAALERISAPSQLTVFEVKSSIRWARGKDRSLNVLRIHRSYSEIIEKMKINPQWTDFGWIWCFKVGANEIHWYTTRRITCTLDELEKVPEEERENKVNPVSHTFGKIFGQPVVAKPFFKLVLANSFSKDYKQAGYIPPEFRDQEEAVPTPESTDGEENDLQYARPEEDMAKTAIFADLNQLRSKLNAPQAIDKIEMYLKSWNNHRSRYLDPTDTEANPTNLFELVKAELSRLLERLKNMNYLMEIVDRIESSKTLLQLSRNITNLAQLGEDTWGFEEIRFEEINDKIGVHLKLISDPGYVPPTDTDTIYESKKRLKENKKLKNGCIPARRRISSGGKTGSYANARTGGKQAYSALKKVKPPSKTKNICCHKCPNDRSAPNGYVCTNPAHLYWGTKGDNTVDQHHGNGTASKNESELRSDIKAYVLELLDERSSKKVTLTKKKLRALIFEAVGAAYFGDDFLEFKRKTESGEFPWDVLRDMGSKAKYVGEGSTRFVYQFADSPDFVVKIINWPKGRDPEEQASTGFKRSNMIDSNKWESDLLIQQRYTEVFPRTYEVAKDHSWILVETVDPIPDYATLFNIMGIDDTIFPANKKVLRMLFIELIADCIEVFQNPGSDMRSIIFKSDLLDEATGMSDFDSYDLSDEDVTIKDPALIKPKEALTPARRSYLETVKKIVDNKQNAKILGAMGSLGIPPREFAPKNLGLSRITKKLVILDASLWEEYTGEKS